MASMNAAVPVINAGDGGHNHPTQTLTDLMTIYLEKKRLDNFTIGFCGDLKFGRTVHSLISTLCRHRNIKIILISPENLNLPSYMISNYINKNHIECIEANDLESVMPELDILYMTRLQKERFTSAQDFKPLNKTYILTMDKLKSAKKDLCIMHPLPRVNEIETAVDADPRACYFKQVLNGKYIRMALILKLLEIE
jgi:aspartate carbamoyltransferase catalytic subunit